jgi:hypothetical protein
MLDWTRSPFVALFFAFDEVFCFVEPDQWSEPEFRGVYALSTSVIGTSRDEDRTRATFSSPEGDQNYRLVSQAGLLLQVPRHIDVERHVRDECAGDTFDSTMIKIRVPSKDRDGCLVALNKMNINHMTLFPDIDGAARHVNSLWQPGHEDSIAHV